VESRYLQIDAKICTGCRICEMTCAICHDKANNPKKGRLRAFRTEVLDYVIACRHCSDPPCAKPCPTNAIYKTDNGMTVVDRKKCIGCKECVEACPFGAMFFDPDRNQAMNCDLCGACVDACPVHCMAITTADKMASRIGTDYITKITGTPVVT
jgi:anaerobic carbon-monoxide dehydrogenase iron sulfur subunit